MTSAYSKSRSSDFSGEPAVKHNAERGRASGVGGRLEGGTDVLVPTAGAHANHACVKAERCAQKRKWRQGFCDVLGVQFVEIGAKHRSRERAAGADDLQWTARGGFHSRDEGRHIPAQRYAICLRQRR